MTALFEEIINSFPEHIISLLSDRCDSGLVYAYLFRRLSVGSVFIFVDKSNSEITIVGFGYISFLRQQNLQLNFLRILVDETKDLIKNLDSYANLSLEISEVLLLQRSLELASTTLQDSFLKDEKMFYFVYNIEERSADEITDELLKKFHAIPTKQSFILS